MTRPSRYLRLASLTLLLGLLVTSAAQERAWLYGGGSYTPTQHVSLSYSLPGRSAPLALYRVGNPQMVLELGGPQDFAASDRLQLEPLRTLTVQAGRYGWGDVDVGILPQGVYFAQLGQGAQASATLILVTDLSLVVKADAEKVLTYTAQTSTGEPRKARLFLMQGSTLHAEGLADDDGLTLFRTDADSLVAAAKYGEAWAFSSAYWNRWAAERSKVYLQTDRPVYRPGQTVYFKGTARAPVGLAPRADSEVHLVVQDADGTEVLRQTFTTDAYGSFSGELALGVEPPLGSYGLEARIDDTPSYASFEVQAYQKPEYRVTVTPEVPQAIQGDTTRMTIRAEYLFGGPVAGGNVSYALLKGPYDRYAYRSQYGFYEQDDTIYGGYYGGEMLARDTGTLDDNGELVVEVALPQDEKDYRLTLQAGVTDEVRREIQGTGRLVAYRAGVVLEVTTDRYAYRTGEDVTLTVRAEDLAGNPVSTAFSVQSERYRWLRGQGQQREPGQTLEGQTGEDGTARLRLRFDQQSSYAVIVQAQDAQGRATTARDDFWVSDGSPWYWAYDGLSLRSDKPEYKVGDTARIVLESPVADAYALITQEGARLGHYELVKLQGTTLTYELPVTAAMAPNSYLSVVVVGNGQTYSETVGLRVPPEDKFLNVEITSEADQYRPGNVGSFRLRVSDHNGAGVRAQLTLGLVDEAIYLLRPENTPDIRAFFYALRDNQVGTQLSAWMYFGQASARPGVARAPMTDAVFAQSKGDFADAEVRDDFRDTALWLPTLETDADGLAEATVTFPDNLTTWRLTVRAISRGDEVGQDTYGVTTTLPVIARLAAPRFLVRGDRADLRVIAQSRLESDQQGQLGLSALGLELTTPGAQTVTLAAGGQASAPFAVRAVTSGSATLEASAFTPAFSDTLRVPLPVLPHGVREEVGWAGRGSSRWTFTLPTTTDLAFTRGTLYLTPSLAAAVAPALSYLAGYPYGCTEQTMSRFLPSVLAAQAGDLAQLPGDVADNLLDIVQAGLRRLYDFQHDDGGWGFWQYDDSSLFITAYVVNGLLSAQAAGYTVREGVLGEALEYLERASQGRGGDDPLIDADGRAYAFYALARAGRAIDGLGRVVGRADMSPYGLALSVLAFYEVGRDVEANLYLDELLSRVVERVQVAYWETGAPRYAWNDDRVEATAYALMALAKLRPDAPVLGKVVNWLLLERQGARWVSTKDTAAVVQAALTLAQTTGEASNNTQVRASLNGQEVFAGRLEGQTGLEVPLAGLNAGRNRLELSVDGGTLYASANVAYIAEGDFTEPQTDALAITRTFDALTPQREGERVVYRRHPFGGESAPGDYLLVTVRLEPRAAYRYVLVNEPLAAGYRVLENDDAFPIAEAAPSQNDYGWNRPYDGREVRDERIDFYLTSLTEPVTFTYLLRAETPGEYSALPTQAWLMYEPEVRGVGTQTTLKIAGE